MGGTNRESEGLSVDTVWVTWKDVCRPNTKQERIREEDLRIAAKVLRDHEEDSDSDGDSPNSTDEDRAKRNLEARLRRNKRHRDADGRLKWSFEPPGHRNADGIEVTGSVESARAMTCEQLLDSMFPEQEEVAAEPRG